MIWLTGEPFEGVVVPTREDMQFAAHALRGRFVSQTQVHRAVRCLEAYEQQGASRTMPGVMVAKGYLSHAEASRFLGVLGLAVQKCEQCLAERYTGPDEPESVPACDLCAGHAEEPLTRDANGIPETAVAMSAFAPDPEPERDPLIGREVPPFRILRKLGQGGMGCVYYAENMDRRRAVAVKVLPREDATEDERVIERFLREGRVASRLEHANIVKVYDVGCIHDFYYIEMEYVEGRTIRSCIDRLGLLLPAEAVMVAAGVLRALAVAHAEGLVHRDVKPENIMLTRYGRVKLADFGVVKDMTETTQLTRSGCVMGTPWYMAPEQCLGLEIDARADIYGLGLTMYHMLTGERPFQAKNALAVMRMQREEPLPDLAARSPETPAHLCAIVRKMAAKNPEHRFAGAEDVLRQIRRLWRSGAVPASPLILMIERYAKGADTGA